MCKEKILEILENAKDENGAVPMKLVRTAFGKLSEPCEDTISRQAAINVLCSKCIVNTPETCSTIQKGDNWCEEVYMLKNLPSAQPEYEPVTAEDFARTMSETSTYRYMAWYSEALSLMKRQGFVICKKVI